MLQRATTMLRKARRRLWMKYALRGVGGSDNHARLDLAYAVADLVISRAGASSVSELCNLGLPGILVPSPNVAEDHQTRNAMALVTRDAAVLVKDQEARSVLIDTAIKLVNDDHRRHQLAANIIKLAYPDAATVIAREVLKLAGYRHE